MADGHTNGRLSSAIVAAKAAAKRTPPGEDTSPESDGPLAYGLHRFDRSWLPGPLRPFTESHAGNLGVPLEMVALQALGLPSLLAGHAVDIEARNGFTQPVTLYVLTIADSGTGKSPAMSRFTKFIMLVEQQRRDEAQRHHEARMEELKQLAGAKNDEGAEAKEELARLRKVGPPQIQLFVTDATDEALGGLMQASGGVAAVWAAEPKFFRVAAGAYSKAGPATDIMLDAYSGGVVRVARQTQGRSVAVDRSRLAIVMMSQRKPVEDFLEKTGHDERGELARFLMVTPPDWRGFKVFGPGVPLDNVALAEECCRRLGRVASQPARAVRLSERAQERFEAWEAQHQVLQRPKGPWREPASWVSKMPGLVLRVAGVLHMTESVMEGSGGEIAGEVPLERIERGIAVTEWGFEQACHVYRVTQENVVSRRLDRLRGVLREAPGGLLRSELWKRIKNTMGITKARDLDELLDELEKCGDLRREQTPPGPRGGRPGERLWLLEGSRDGFEEKPRTGTGEATC